MQTENWKDVVGFESYFKVSDHGRLYSKRTNKILKQTLSKTGGYLTVATRIGGKNGINYCFKVHRLVAEAFLNPPSEELLEVALNTVHKLVLVNHKDGNKTNNHVSNLEWCSHRENTLHALKHNLLKPRANFQMSNSSFKTKKEVELLYEQFKKSNMSLRKFSASVGRGRRAITEWFKKLENNEI